MTVQTMLRAEPKGDDVVFPIKTNLANYLTPDTVVSEIILTMLTMMWCRLNVQHEDKN